MEDSQAVTTTDTCIIGAGPQGLAAALQLELVAPSMDVTVIDHSDQWLTAVSYTHLTLPTILRV